MPKKQKEIEESGISKIFRDNIEEKKISPMENTALGKVIQEATNNLNLNTKEENIANAFYKVIESLMSESNIDQKSILNFSQIIGCIELGSYNHYLMVTFGIRSEVIDFYILDVIVKFISHQGAGRNSLVELFKNVRESLEKEYGNKLNKYVMGVR
jgi:hypothetical protein